MASTSIATNNREKWLFCVFSIKISKKEPGNGKDGSPIVWIENSNLQNFHYSYQKMAAEEQVEPAILWCDNRSKKLTISRYQVLFIRYFQYRFDSHSILNLGKTI